MEIRDEYDCFQSIIQGLKIAASGAVQMSRFRPDMRDPWLKVAEVLNVTSNSVFQLGEESTARKTKQ